MINEIKEMSIKLALFLILGSTPAFSKIQITENDITN